MRLVGVVVDPPLFDELAGLVEVDEQVFIEALVPQSAVELSTKPFYFSRKPPKEILPVRV